RCGIAGPILHQQFVKALEARRRQQGQSSSADNGGNNDDSIGVFMVSHTGGHKFAGNVLVYPAGIWYGRVNACHVDAILDRTVFDNQVIRELYRG
ncbi:Sucraseferredoxin-like protein, partial [Syncephalis pseudoplumigaleata]